ncbi:hypothetical protein AV530_003582 [Patagioenas fasciata monilis]|uniref:Uncharacterized protein n=1 Tax=Patagioenas fasciata monilis TaxID=372326 RepID=A0A1V4KY99_PATFA|nr:hypothetical protein AV530_003582 [Patagioenas fasciata monilis]
MHLKPLGMARRGKRWQVEDDLDPTTSSSNGLSLQNRPCTSVTTDWSRRAFVPMASRPMQASGSGDMPDGTRDNKSQQKQCALRFEQGPHGMVWSPVVQCHVV